MSAASPGARNTQDVLPAVYIIIYCTDSAGYRLPDEVSEKIGLLRAELSPSIEVEFHGHHNMGMAIANSLAAVEAGAARIDGSVAGQSQLITGGFVSGTTSNVGAGLPGICYMRGVSGIPRSRASPLLHGS